MILWVCLWLTICWKVNSLCQMPKKIQEKIGTLIYESIFDESKGKHDEKLDGCMKDDYRVEWFEVFFENEKERKRVEEIEKKVKEEKEKKMQSKKNPLLDLFAKIPEVDVPESRYYYAVLAIKYDEVKPLRLPMLPPPKGPPETEPFKPVQVKIKARLGNYTDEVKRTVTSTFKNPLIKALIKPSFKPDQLTEKLVKAIKFAKEPKCQVKIEQNPMVAKKTMNILHAKDCKIADIGEKRLRFEDYNKLLDGDEYVYGFKVRRLEFCKKHHRHISEAVAAKKPLFYKLFGCWYKKYPIKIEDKLVKEIDKHLVEMEEKDKKEKEAFNNKYVLWTHHPDLARKRIEEEKWKQREKEREERRRERERLRKERARRRRRQRMRRRRRSKAKKKASVLKKATSKFSKMRKPTVSASKGAGGLTRQRKYSAFRKKNVIDLNGKLPSWMGGMLNGVNLNPFKGIGSKKNSKMPKKDEKMISGIYKRSSSVSGKGQKPKRRFRGRYYNLGKGEGKWGNKVGRRRGRSKRGKKRAGKKKDFRWGWDNYHMKSGRIRNWGRVWKVDRKLFLGNLNTNKPAPKPEKFEWPMNPAFEYSLVYNSILTKDIFFRKEKIKMSVKNFKKFMEKTGEPAPMISPFEGKLEEIPEDEFPEYVERDGKVFKVVYENVKIAEEDLEKKEEELKQKKKEEEKQKEKEEMQSGSDRVKQALIKKKQLTTDWKLKAIMREIEDYKRKAKLGGQFAEQKQEMEDQIHEKIEEYRDLEKDKLEYEEEAGRMKMAEKKLPAKLEKIEQTLKEYEKLEKETKTGSRTPAQDKEMGELLTKVEKELGEIESIEALIKQEDEEEKKGKEKDSKEKDKEKTPEEEAKEEVEEEKKEPKLIPDHVEGLLVTVGMHYLSLGPLDKKITALTFVPLLQKEFPEAAVPGVKAKMEGGTLNLVDSDDKVAVSFGVAKKEIKKRVSGKLEPFVYQRWLFVRESFEAYYVDALKHYKRISKEEAEIKHKEHMKRKNAHYQKIYDQIKSGDKPQAQSSEAQPIDTISVPKRPNPVRMQRILSEQRETRSEGGLNWLVV